MGTKNNPAPYDCYANAHPDEPMFVLLGRDKIAASLVFLWADARESLGEDATKLAEARECAGNMLRWCAHEANKAPLHALQLLPFDMLARELRRRGATVTPAPNGGNGEQADPESWERDNERTLCLLLLCGGHDVTDEIIAGWTDEQCQQAEDWAGREHLAASDNDDVERVPMPPHVKAHPPKPSSGGLWG